MTDRNDTAAQFLRYGIAGGSALGVHLLVLWGLHHGLGVDKVLASALGFLFAIPVNYWLQHRFVFRSKSDHRIAATRYVATTMAGLALNTVLFAAATLVLAIPYLLAQVAVTVLVFIANFLVNRAFTFAARPTPDGNGAGA